MQTFLDDPVDVVVSFEHNRVRPRRMRWDGREYSIAHVNMVHSAHEGSTRLFFFSVSDTTNHFKLKLNTDLLEWRLIELYTDG